MGAHNKTKTLSAVEIGGKIRVGGVAQGKWKRDVV